MTVDELILHLQRLGMPQARVVVPGFDEYQLDDVKTICRVEVVFHDSPRVGNLGPHEYYDDAKRKAHDVRAQTAVLLNF